MDILRRSYKLITSRSESGKSVDTREASNRIMY